MIEKNTTKEEWAFIAGFFEGEGSVGLRNRNDRKSGKKALHLQIWQSDLDVLLRVREMIGAGWICGPYLKKTHKAIKQIKPQWCYSVSGYIEIERFFVSTMKWLSARRKKQFQDALDGYLQHRETLTYRNKGRMVTTSNHNTCWSI